VQGTNLGQHRDEVLVAEPIARNQGGGVAVPEHVRKLPRLRPRAHRHQRGPEECHRKVGQEPLRPVPHQQRHRVAGAHAEAIEAFGKLPYAAPVLRVGQPVVLPDDGLALGVAGGDLVEQIGQRTALRALHR
jgi:hypothetical protein